MATKLHVFTPIEPECMICGDYRYATSHIETRESTTDRLSRVEVEFMSNYPNDEGWDRQVSQLAQTCLDLMDEHNSLLDTVWQLENQLVSHGLTPVTEYKHPRPEDWKI